jgi:hypothetical protein
MAASRIKVGLVLRASERPPVDSGNVSRTKYEMKLCGSPAEFVRLDRPQPEPRKPARALMSNVFLANFVRNEQRVTATEAMDMEGTADVALADLLRIGEQPDATEGIIGLGRFHFHLGKAIPEDPAALAWPKAFRPLRRVEIRDTVEGDQANAHRVLSAPQGRIGMTSRADEVAVPGIDIVHHAEKRFHVLDVNLSLDPLRLDDRSTEGVGSMPRLDENIDLSQDATPRSHDACIRRDAQPCRNLVGEQLRDHALIDLPGFHRFPSSLVATDAK